GGERRADRGSGRVQPAAERRQRRQVGVHRERPERAEGRAEHDQPCRQPVARAHRLGILWALADVDLLVSGGGIAGLTGGPTARRLGRKTLVLTGGPAGGLLVSIDSIEGVPGFPDGIPGYDLCPMTMEQAEAAGAGFGMAEVTGIEAQGDGWRVTAD